MPHRSYFLDLRSLADFRPKPFAAPGVTVARAAAGDAGLCRELWREAGRGYWTDRDDWNPEDWGRHLADPTVSFWIARLDGTAIGFFELHAGTTEVKIEGLGLLPPWRGQGLGGGLVSAATSRAFRLGARRVWLHTASGDHPAALGNYLRRGYRIYHEEERREPRSGRP